mmetsp:Transcript_43381/g.52585  ORF Transcript_43381/g.52585 Transcript_43381/m.52585 type:complete len:87 (-) Transcript_43381:104-364(-)
MILLSLWDKFISFDHRYLHVWHCFLSLLKNIIISRKEMRAKFERDIVAIPVRCDQLFTCHNNNNPRDESVPVKLKNAARSAHKSSA